MSIDGVEVRVALDFLLVEMSKMDDENVQHRDQPENSVQSYEEFVAKLQSPSKAPLSATFTVAPSVIAVASQQTVAKPERKYAKLVSTPFRRSNSRV